jgi:polysaccharide export outer membrane protein
VKIKALKAMAGLPAVENEFLYSLLAQRNMATKKEALAMAGDMTVYGMRDNVKLVRENANGERIIQTLNLNDADLIRSPYFYLQQNDILYVSPNKTVARNSDIGNSTTIWISATSILVSIASLLVTVFK